MAYELRPLSLGELLDRAWNLYRRHLLLFVGILAFPSIALLVISIGIQLTQPDVPTATNGEPPDPALLIGTFVWMALGGLLLFTVYWVSYAIALGATTGAVAELYQGRTPSIRGAYQSMRGRAGRLAWLMFLVFLRLFGTMFLAILATGVLVGILAALSPVLGALVALPLVGSTAILFVWMALRYAISIPPAVLEEQTASEAIARSIDLTRGNLWRVFVLLLFTMVVAYAGMAVTQGPFLVAAIMAGPETATAFWLNMAGVIAGGIAGAFTGPLAIIAMAVLYYDLRIRKEGFDLELMIADLRAESQAAAPQPG